MKKVYVQPCVKVFAYKYSHEILAASGVTGDNGIDYGGVDDGTHDPAAKEFHFNLWEEETDNSFDNG